MSRHVICQPARPDLSNPSPSSPRHPDHNHVHVPVRMPILSTNRGHIGASDAPERLQFADFDSPKMRKGSGRSLSASSVRWPGRCIVCKSDGSPESLGENDKSIWEHYNEMAAVDDNIRETEWRDLADTILVFVCLSTFYDVSLLIRLQDGLFAAFLSAFLVFTIPQLQPSSTDITMDVLIHISQQLNNSTTPAYSPTEFAVSPSIGAVNALFFLSLALVLIDAFLAMLVKSWLQEFDRGWRKYTVASLRAQERERRLQGLERWKLAELVVLLPILIQTSLLFFCIGLIVLLFPIHLVSALFSALALAAGITFYAFTIYVSIFDVYAPFSSPVSRGLIILAKALQTTWTILIPLIVRSVQGIISGLFFHISRPLSPREHEENIDPSTKKTPGGSKVSLARGNMGVEKQEEGTRSHSQIDPQTYADILGRLVTTTAVVVENIPVFLELLDQPVKHPTLLPSNVKKWKDLLHMTLGLLGDPSTFSDSVARTITRSVLFCYDVRQPADEQLSRRLIDHFNHICSGQPDQHKPLNTLFASHLEYYFGHSTKIDGSIIASLEPSNAADAELLWMVNTIHKNLLWQYDQFGAYVVFLEFFAAVLTYVSSTEQSRRSQVPLTAAVIYAMFTIKSALETGGIDSIDGPYILPGTFLTTSESISATFHHVDVLDLWSRDCVEFASSLLQPHTHWSGFDEDHAGKFQLALIAALYTDCTRQARHASAAFEKLLRLINIPNITESTWGWPGAHDQTKLASYWYMALFQELIGQNSTQSSPVDDIGYVIMQTIDHCSDLTLSALHLLETSLKHLFAMASPSSIFLTRNTYDDLCLRCTTSDGYIAHYSSQPLNPWILLHLDTLFSQCSFLHRRELEQLEWRDTPEQVHIAMARLTLYDSLQGEEHEETKQLQPDPHLLNLFLWSKDYAVCTGAFECCLKLVTIGQLTGDIHGDGTFIPEIIGSQWIEHLIQVLCGPPEHQKVKSWEFLVEHFAPKWAMLPSSWCYDFALVFLSSTVHLPDINELPVYQWFARALIDLAYQSQIFLPFLGDMLELTQNSLNWHQLTSIETWLAQLPEILANQDAHVNLENILATRKQQLVDETCGFLAELPMRYPECMNDVQ